GDHGNLPAQALDQHGRDIAAAVGAHVDDERFLFQLRIEVLDELVEAIALHVGHMEIANLASGRVADLLDVALYPAVVAQVGLAGDGNDDNLSAALFLRLGVELERHLLANGADQAFLEIGHLIGWLTIDGDDVILLMGIDADLRQGRAELGVPVGAVEDLADLVIAGSRVAGDGGTQLAGLQARGLGHFAAADISMA